MLRRVRILTTIFIIGLALSGATAIPLLAEVDWLVGVTKARNFPLAVPADTPAWALWLCKVQDAIHLTADKNGFLFYGTDWLAFGHFVPALAFVGALHDPVKNRWLFTWGMLACAFLVPYAFVFGAIRGIPVWWRLIDCSFGIIGFMPLWLCRHWLKRIKTENSQTSSRLVISDPWR